MDGKIYIFSSPTPRGENLYLKKTRENLLKLYPHNHTEKVSFWNIF